MSDANADHFVETSRWWEVVVHIPGWAEPFTNEYLRYTSIEMALADIRRGVSTVDGARIFVMGHAIERCGSRQREVLRPEGLFLDRTPGPEAAPWPSK